MLLILAHDSGRIDCSLVLCILLCEEVLIDIRIVKCTVHDLLNTVDLEADIIKIPLICLLEVIKVECDSTATVSFCRDST